MADIWRDGEVAVLRGGTAPPVIVPIRRGSQRLGHDLVVDLGSQIGRAPGDEFPLLGETYRLLRPTLADLLGSIERSAQIVTPKDAVHLAYLIGAAPGGRVAEAGAGSGAMTIALAHAVGPSGHVTSYDRRADFLAVARRNVERAGFADRVEFRERDVARDGLDVWDLAGIALDLPEPWEVVASARGALAPGGAVAAYTPTYNQLERTVRAMRTERLTDVRALELIERALHVGDGGTRPAFEMLGHTGFLSVGRKVG